MFVGIDLGQRRIHIVALDESLNLTNALVMEVADIEDLPRVLQGAKAAPSMPPKRFALRHMWTTRA